MEELRHEQRAALAASRPIIRSVLAFLLYLRFGHEEISEAYSEADSFLEVLKSDLKA